MYHITLDNEKLITEIQLSNNIVSGKINNNQFTAEIHKTHSHQYFIKYKNQSFEIILLKVIPEEKKLIIKINGKRQSIQVKDKFDILLEQLGMDKMNVKKSESIKAPMPGKILNILVSEGQAVKKGDTILILEAMKMENALKAPHDGVVKKIAVNKGSAVEKNQLLIEL